MSREGAYSRVRRRFARRRAALLAIAVEIMSPGWALAEGASNDGAPAPAPPVARASEARGPLVWKGSNFSEVDALVTGAAAFTTFTSVFIAPRANHGLTGGIGFDEPLRDALRPSSRATRDAFRDASQVGISLSLGWPFLADALVTAWQHRGSAEVAKQMVYVDLEALAVSGALQGITNVLVSRERPYGRTCGGELSASDSDCASSGRYRSFFSGHTTYAFTAASLVCVHHIESELWGPPWDALSCAAGYTVAATTATFRVVSDMHYASDVLTGALVGTLVGYGVPLLHYRAAKTSRPGEFSWWLAPAAGGLGIAGAF